ncbi:MAG: SPFH domain-containing protein [Candidatus Obscuribacterales bacterium]|nr:SPFH domain-containing protein [Candidatus Obscuribacterales bacterium]
MEDSSNIGFYVTLGLTAVLAILFICTLIGSIRITPPKHFRAKLRQGRFIKIVGSGPCLKLPIFETLTAPWSLQSQQHVIKVNTTTKDKVPVVLELTIAIRVKTGREREAMFNLREPLKQIESHVGKVAFAKAPRMDLEEVFTDTTGIVLAVREELEHFLEDNGYDILSVNLNNIILPTTVKDARDAVYEQTQKKLTAEAQGETNKIQTVARATANKQKMKLGGEGVGLQRIAIGRAYANSIKSLGTALGLGKATAEEKRSLRREILVILNKQLDMDTLLKIGVAATKVLMVPQNSSTASDFAVGQLLASSDSK